MSKLRIDVGHGFAQRNELAGHLVDLGAYCRDWCGQRLLLLTHAVAHAALENRGIGVRLIAGFDGLLDQEFQPGHFIFHAALQLLNLILQRRDVALQFHDLALLRKRRRG